MDIRDSYDLWASSYDSVENPTRDLDRIATLETLGRMRFGRILEVGCGTGKNTRLLSTLSGQVQAIDLSLGMIAKAKEKVTAGNVLFAVADVNRPWPRTDESVELVSCNLILEHIEDLRCIFREAHRCLIPGGKLFICELHPAKQYEGKRANFLHEGTRTEIPAYVHHMSDFFSAGVEIGFSLLQMKEWWHKPDRDSPPLLLSFLFAK